MKWPAINPVAAFFGPIFQKEVRSAGRRRATYLLRSCYVLALLVIVSIAFFAARESGFHAGAVQRVQQLQTLAPILTGFVMWFQFIAMLLIAPMLAAPVICDERRARTLATLMTTPLRAGDIIIGKLSSRLVQLVILSLLVVPILLAVRIFGGLDAMIVIAFMSVSLSLAVLGASLGVLYSIWHQRATSAAFFALLTVVLMMAAPSGILATGVYLLNEYAYSGKQVFRFPEQILVTASPFALSGLSVSLATGDEIPWFTVQWPWLARNLGQPANVNPLGTIGLAPFWVATSLYHLLMASLISGVSVLVLRRIMRREDGEGVRAPRAKSRRRGRRAPKDAIPPAQEDGADSPIFVTQEEATRDRATSRSVGDRPVLWRELRRSSIRSKRLRIVVFLLAVFGIALIYAIAGIHNEGLQMTLAILGPLIIMLQVVFMTTGSVAAEREARTWEVLLTTPLTGREIVLSKYLATLRAQWFLPTLVLVHYAISAAVGAMPWFFLAQLVLILLGPVLFFTATGQYLSLKFRKGIVGAVLNLLLALLIWMLIWPIVGLVAWFMDDFGPAWDPVWNVLYAINPLTMAWTAGEAVADGHFNRVAAWRLRSNIRYEMYGLQSFSEFNAWIAGVFAFYAFTAWAVLRITIARFRALGGRSS